MQPKHNKQLVPLAKQLRKEMTKEERHLWYDFLRSYPVRFSRQKVLGKYIADFYCAEAKLATVYKGNIIKNLIMDCQSYTKYRPNETTGGIFVSWRRKEELPTGA